MHYQIKPNQTKPSIIAPSSQVPINSLSLRNLLEEGLKIILLRTYRDDDEVRKINVDEFRRFSDTRQQSNGSFFIKGTGGSAVLHPGKAIADFAARCESKGISHGLELLVDGPNVRLPNSKILVIGPGTSTEIFKLLENVSGIGEIHLLEISESAVGQQDLGATVKANETPLPTLVAHRTTMLRFPEGLPLFDIILDTNIFALGCFKEGVLPHMQRQICKALKPGGLHLTGGDEALQALPGEYHLFGLNEKGNNCDHPEEPDWVVPHHHFYMVGVKEMY